MLDEEKFECEEAIGFMMGELTSAATEDEWNIEDARAGKYGGAWDDDSIPF